MFDVFYIGKKPRLFAHEREVDSIQQAQQQCRTRYCWIVNYLSDYTGWDWLWEPVPWQNKHTHVWPSQWHDYSGTYLVPKNGTGELNFHTEVIPNRECQDNWTVPENVDKNSIDWTWAPHPLDPPYVYHFPSQHQSASGVTYTVPAATDVKLVNPFCVTVLTVTDNWATVDHANIDTIDYSWHPHPLDPPYIYVFGNQWYPAEIMPTVEYRVPGATERKYVDEPRACLASRHTNHWHTLIDCEWDYSWQPEPGSPPLIFVFGNQHWPAVKMPTVEYHMSGATDRKYMDYPVARLLPEKDNWLVPEEVNSDSIDFTWVPDPDEPPYIYHFGTDYQDSVGLTYTVPGATELKFAGEIPTTKSAESAVAVLDIFYLDYSNHMSAARLAQLKEHYPDIQRVRYVNSLVDTIRRCASKSTTTRFWVISSRNVYDNFDFAWHAEPWQNSMTHVFGSQWNKWSDTFLINKWEFERHARWAAGIEQFPNLNFVADQTVTAPTDACDIYVVDHGNGETQAVLDFLSAQYRVVKRARYFDNYLDTLRRLLADVDADHVWVVSSICDYTQFDFSWQPEAWQRDMLHVFPSNEQKFGDTFYVPVQSLRDQIDRLELLDWFDTVHYCNDQRVARWAIPVFEHTADSHVDCVRTAEFSAPVALFTNRPIKSQDIPSVNLWRAQTKTVVPLDSGGAAVVVPRVAVGSIQKQLYDYPYIDKTQRKLVDQPLDIVFISNGEPNADANWLHLQRVSQGKPNRCVRVDGVSERGAAYKAAAEASQTPWFFAVFAKLEVDDDFDWTWQPDRLQQAKHYIFNARNPVNGLEYGHQGLIAYNKKLVIATEEIQGLDFTLSQPHGVEPVLSGVAHYNTDPWSTWRTAFREVAKLQYYAHVSPDVETDYRLGIWQSRAEGNNAEWSLRGAQDAVEYYQSVDGQYDQLLLTFEWAWLRQYFDNKYQA